MGTGWYRRQLIADSSWIGRRVLLDFGGIMLNGDVYLNGHLVGGTDYGYLGFEIDVTKLLNYDKPNVIAVRADTGKPENSRWYTGGGLYRNVNLVVTDRDMYFMRHPLYITTPHVESDKASVKISAEIAALKHKGKELKVKTRITDADGNLIYERLSDIPFNRRQKTNEYLIDSISIDNPRLWDCDSPHLYTARLELLAADGSVADEVEESFGIRKIEYSPEYGLKLNGKKVLLKGISNHHDAGGCGRRGLRTGYRTAVRNPQSVRIQSRAHHSHNPYSESFLRLADKHGILIVDELFDKWDKDYWIGRRSWRELWPELVPEWIRRDRNHPSVILWSLGNELQIKEEWSGYPTGDWGVTTYRMMDVLVKRYDPTRKTTVAMFPALRGSLTKNDPDFHKPESVAPPELSVATDVASYNYRYMFFPRYRELHPHLIFYQSEAATQAMGSAFYGMDLDTVVGLAYWGAIEYWGESNAWPWKGWHFSFFDRTLQPYPQAWFVKSMFESEPVVRIGIQDDSDVIEWNDVQVGKANISSHWNRPAGSTPNVVVYTNAEEVELTLNGRSLGIRQNPVNQPDQRNTLHWDSIAYQPGATDGHCPHRRARSSPAYAPHHGQGRRSKTRTRKYNVAGRWHGFAIRTGLRRR